MKKSLFFWIYFIIAIIFATYLSVRLIMVFTPKNNTFTVKKISISADSNKNYLSQIGTMIGIPPGTRTFSVSLADIKDKLYKIPDIKTSAVRKLSNGNIDVKLEMHKIVAVWTDETSFYPVSNDGTIINRLLSEKPKNSIIFMGTIPDNLSGIIKSLQTIKNQIECVQRIENRRWDIITKNKIKIMLPEKNENSAIGQLIILDKKNALLSKNLKVIDMRSSERILVK